MMKGATNIFIFWMVIVVAILRCRGHNLLRKVNFRTNEPTDEVLMKFLGKFDAKERISTDGNLPPQLKNEMPYKSANIATSFPEKENHDSSSYKSGTEKTKVEKPNIDELLGSRRTRSVSTEDPCRKHDLWIDFGTLNNGVLASFIVFPEKYNAYQCRGACVEPFEDEDTSMHAKIQSMAHLDGMEGVEAPCLPAPCCVPTKLKPLRVIYKEFNDTNYFDGMVGGMVVEECGCRY